MGGRSLSRDDCKGFPTPSKLDFERVSVAGVYTVAQIFETLGALELPLIVALPDEMLKKQITINYAGEASGLLQTVADLSGFYVWHSGSAFCCSPAVDGAPAMRCKLFVLRFKQGTDFSVPAPSVSVAGALDKLDFTTAWAGRLGAVARGDASLTSQSCMLRAGAPVNIGTSEFLALPIVSLVTGYSPENTDIGRGYERFELQSGTALTYVSPCIAGVRLAIKDMQTDLITASPLQWRTEQADSLAFLPFGNIHRVLVRDVAKASNRADIGNVFSSSQSTETIEIWASIFPQY